MSASARGMVSVGYIKRAQSERHSHARPSLLTPITTSSSTCVDDLGHELVVKDLGSSRHSNV